MTEESRFAYLAGNGKGGRGRGGRGRQGHCLTDKLRVLYPPASDEAAIKETEQARLVREAVARSLRFRQRLGQI